MAKQKFGKWEFTDREIEEQLDESARLGESELEPEATAIRYINNAERISLEFSDGFSLAFPASKIKELRNASPSEIRKGALTVGGDAIHWDNLDAHYTVAGLLLGRFGTKKWIRELGSMGGSKTSVAKAATARLNGQKGGRPASRESQTLAPATSRSTAASAGSVWKGSKSARATASKSSTGRASVRATARKK